MTIQIGLYLICQRYKFESESQLKWIFLLIGIAVFNMSKIQIWKRITTVIRLTFVSIELYLICQRYKFESESQLTSDHFALTLAVFNMSKIQIWKRITTEAVLESYAVKLYLICQRYKFESESQPLIENEGWMCAVFNMSKIQIWKRITTELANQNLFEMLYLRSEERRVGKEC